MLTFALRVLAVALGLGAAASFVPGVTIIDVPTLALAALLLGLVNAVVRPVVVILTLPLTLLTLGLFILVINAGLFALVSTFLHGFVVHGFWAAFWGSLVVSFVGWLASAFIGKRGRFTRWARRRR